jgi:hypothetical protein
MAFFQQRDYNLFQSLNKELVNDFIETPVIVYKVEKSQTEKNIYGESVGGKSYMRGLQINAYIERNDQETNYEGFGSDVQQGITFRFLRSLLVDVNVVLEIGDIVKFNDAFFEINAIVENQLVAGNTDFTHSIICSTQMARRSKLNIEELY